MQGTNEMTFRFKKLALVIVTSVASSAFQISRRAFLVDTTMSCGELVKRSSPLVVDNIKEEAIRDVWMSSRQTEYYSFYSDSELDRDVASNYTYRCYYPLRR